MSYDLTHYTHANKENSKFPDGPGTQQSPSRLPKTERGNTTKPKNRTEPKISIRAR